MCFFQIYKSTFFDFSKAFDCNLDDGVLKRTTIEVLHIKKNNNIYRLLRVVTLDAKEDLKFANEILKVFLPKERQPYLNNTKIKSTKYFK